MNGMKYEVDEIMSHRGMAGPKQSCLVRFKDLMIRTTNDSLGSGSTKQRSSRMNNFFVETKLQEVQQNKSNCDPLLVNERYFRSYDKWRDQRRAPLHARAAKKATEDASSRPPAATSSSGSSPSSTTRAGRASIKTVRDEGYISSTFTTNSFFQMV